MGFRIRDINFIEPRELRKEVDKINSKLEAFFNSSSDALNINDVIVKLRNGQILRTAEIRLLLYNQDEFQDETLKGMFEAHLKKIVTEANFLYFFGTALSILSPWSVITSLRSVKEHSLNRPEVPRVISLYIDTLQSFRNRDDFVTRIAQNYSKISVFLEELSFLHIEAPLFGVILRSLGSYGFFRNDLEKYLELLFKVHGSSGFNAIEMHLERFMNETPTWSNSLGLKDSFLSQLLFNLSKTGRHSNEYGPRLREVLNFSKLINEAFLMLRGGSTERADFWENISSRFSQILPRKFGKDLIGLALYLPKHVIVEFAPTGNAAYIYKIEVFEEKIKNAKDWKDRELAGDRTFVMPNFSGPLGVIRDGHFRHNRYWQNDMLTIVKRLENV